MGFRRLTAWLAAIIVCVTSSLTPNPALSSPPQGDSFLKRCPILLSRLPELAGQCESNARLLVRTFNGFAEKRGAFFLPDLQDSHFGLGCTVGRPGEIVRIGIFYTAQPATFNIANAAPLADINAAGDVLIGGPDGLRSLVFVRNFTSIPLHLAAGPFDKITNCADPKGPDGAVYLSTRIIHPVLRTENEFVLVNAELAFASPGGRYKRLLRGDSLDIIGSDFAGAYLIMEDGTLLVHERPFEHICVTKQGRYGPIPEACP